MIINSLGKLRDLEWSLRLSQSVQNSGAWHDNMSRKSVRLEAESEEELGVAALVDATYEKARHSER